MSHHDYLAYWGKSPAPPDPGFHGLAYHCLDVAAVGMACLEKGGLDRERLTRISGLGREDLPRWLGFLLALHDLGKFASSFQNQRPDLVALLGRQTGNPRHGVRHGELGLRVWDETVRAGLQDGGATPFAGGSRGSWRELQPLARAVFGHHGLPPEHGQTISAGEFFTPQDRQAALNFALDAFRLFGLDTRPWPERAARASIQKPLSWTVAGLAVLCDWIGSNQEDFSCVGEAMSLPDYFQRYAVARADAALARSGVLIPKPRAWRGFQTLFPAISSPSPLQEHLAAMVLDPRPQLHILEDVTGSGKTEAALALAHRLMDAGLAQGVYLGLPTMATASAMYGRMRRDYRRLFAPGGGASLILAHAARDLDPDFRHSMSRSGVCGDAGQTKRGQDPDFRHSMSLEDMADNGDRGDGDDQGTPATCRAWLADNRKKSLLAAVGVGTLDQALLAALPAKHQSLRLLGLGRCVLIADEVHAYDAYTNKLLEILLQFQAAQGGSAILLSATLPGCIKERLAKAFARGLGIDPPELRGTDYPLATVLEAGGCVREVHLAARADVSRHVAVERLASVEAAVQAVAQAARAGACALYVRNTVDDAVEAWRALDALLPDRVDLFHARFTLADRQGIEQGILDHFGKGSVAGSRRGRVVVATQVAEQSLDVDFDLVVSDLAPMESLIQRAGRCCRHPGRQRPEGFATARLLVVSPDPADARGADWYGAMFPGGAHVYPGHGRLWLTAKLLFGQGGFDLAKQGRELMEGVYGDEALEGAPEALTGSDIAFEGGAMAEEALACDKALKPEQGYSRVGVAWADEEKVFTRLGQESVTLRLCRLRDGRVRPFADETGDDALAWRLSEVQTPAWRFKTAQPPANPEEARALAVAVAAMPGQGRWVVTLVMHPDAAAPGVWSAQGRNANGERVEARYSAARGLEWGKKPEK